MNKALLVKTAFILPSFLTGLALANPSYQPGVYTIDPSHSSVGFEVPHLVISTVEGKFTSYEGAINLKNKLTQSSVNVAIDTQSIDTGTKKRDDHLRSSDFFETEKYPKMTFKSTSVKGDLQNLKVTGDLTIKGVTKKVVLSGKYLGSVVDGYGNVKAAFDFKTKINRKDFGLNWSSIVEAGPVVGDEVSIRLKVQAAKK